MNSLERKSKAWMAAFRQKARQERMPISGMIELTSRCNLKCVHCYLGDQDEQHRKRDQEMSTQTVCTLIDELADAGCLFLTFTGGDPMMRKDFAEIYMYARNKGILVTVFCDGILVTDAIIDLFKQSPPRQVEISIYGATPETYESVTRVRGSFKRAVAGIHRLHNEGIRVGLKTVLMSLNVHEYEQMKQMADDLGVGWRFDGAIFPCLHTGDTTPTDYRVPAEDVIKIEMSDTRTRNAWLSIYKASQKQEQQDDRLFKCGAGQTTFYIDPFGDIAPCLMTSYRKVNLTESSFKTRWQEDLAEVRALRTTPGETTENSHFACSTCPAFNYLDTGEERTCSTYQKELTKEREKAIVDMTKSKDIET